MASNHCRSGVRSARRERTDGGEPLNDETRTVQQRNTSLYVNVTEYGVATLDLEKGDNVTIETYRDGIWISPGGAEDD